MKRRKPLRRSPLRSRKKSWRFSAAYKALKARVFAAYERWDGWVRCVFCGGYFPLDRITLCHIRGVKANHELRLEFINNVPACGPCHNEYEVKTSAEKEAAIERVLPGRWAAVAELKREKACVVAR